ncbi:hypothetical protein FisN_5Lh447 [Fistulifera solaris]|uniref:Serine/threonine-protein phosphatase n=1 Tax=Fistulifera solaris TaxID=1519565 RepID=A0A1Z5KGE1_FISSO|nr:hypothetical protein FisN_5Lh447 [Fistulifera solaris]|eukprot:GAX25353.1 hypothetical protein FisN_5Lh447 [Fistulifera solaris]
MNSAQAAEAQLRLQEQELEIETLRQRVKSLSKQLQESLEANSGGGQSADKRRRYQNLSPHQFNVREVKNGTGAKRSMVTAQKQRMGRTASIATRQVLDSIAAMQQSSKPYQDHPSVQRILEMFSNPSQHMEYLNSSVFCKDLLKVASKARHVFEREPRVVFIQSPVYVFGDIHGNLEDLHFFSDNIWRLGMSLTAGNFLFLGDYVDRGLSCLETVAYLLAMKVCLPHKVFLLRGNHETRDVNGWEEHYGERAFIWQCRQRFGDDIGYRIWEACNQVFDRLPLAAVIDQDIFCVHGGIPRPISRDTTRIQDILTVTKVAGINPPYEHEQDEYQQVASDCIWSDPASEEQEIRSVNPETGYGDSLRGGGAICFGNKAVTDFLQQQDFSYIMRAHEAHAEGVAVSKGARVFTVFSTSQDHNQGQDAMAGCILVDNEQLQVINRSPAYKNQYVHRRDSVSLATLSEKEIQQRMNLGLVTAPQMDYSTYANEDDDDEDVDEWEDFVSDTEDEASHTPDVHTDDPNYRLSHGRRSSVDIASMSNVHDMELEDDGDMENVKTDRRTASRASIRSSVSTFEVIAENCRGEEDEDEVDTDDGD